jgi:predicted DNA-binding transcriptional regulator AlpA
MAKTFGRPKSPSVTTPTTRILNYEALRDKGIHYSRSHLRRLWQRDPPEFPVPFQTSPSRIAWRESSIDAWIAQKERTATLKVKGRGR